MDKEHQSPQIITSRFRSTEYELLEKIGEGGFGQVYKAVHRRTQKFVAIKFLMLLDTDHPDKKLRHIERFHRECDLIRRLNHPNVVSLLDKGQQGSEILYAVYEFIDGQTLKEHLQAHGPFSPSDAADVMACVLDALAHAHENGVIHRDIKPANIMLYKVGAKLHVKVLDFGIGTLKNDVRQTDYKTLTLTQETLGTPTYSAPEQLRGEPALPQTDLYVWGLVFIECLTGVPTLSGNSMAAVFHQQLSASNIPLGPLASHHSAHLFRRVLNKKPLQRPGSTVELYQEFRKVNFSDLVISNQQAHAKPSSPEFENQTQINTSSPAYSRITERKQIAALSVILSTHRAQPRHHHVPPTISQDIVDMIHADQIHQCIDIAIRYGAYHVGTLGDTLLFYFGYPTISDNDSRLCARAALDISSNLNGKKGQIFQNHGLISELKIGIEIGLMQGFSGNLPEGKVANDALRLSRLAEPNQILCSEQVKSILENHLIFRPRQSSAPLRSPDAPQYLLLSERVSEAFGFLRSTWKQSAFIGREDTLEALLNDTHEAATEKTEPCNQQRLHRRVHLSGEAGIGKSRLVFEVQEHLQGTSHWVAQCLPEYRNNALFPLLKLIKVRYELDGLNAANTSTKLEHIIAGLDLDPETQSKSLCVLRAWLNLEPTANEDGAQQQQHILAAMSPKQQKDCLFQVLTHLLCRPQPTTAPSEPPSSQLFICEDLHWSDPTTLEFIQYFVGSEPFLHGQHIWISTSRQTLPSDLKQAHFKQIQLGKLTEANCRHMIESLFGHQAVSEDVVRLLIERCDGIPLFLEELVTNIQKQELVCKINGRIEFIGRDPEILIPVTLRESLQQHLDSLTFAKDTVQLAAAIGRMFDAHLLFAASEKDETQILGDLDELQKSGIIYVQRQVNGNRYIFKHALIREAAYESAANVTVLHQQIALALEHSNPGGCVPELLARHWMKANQPERAIPYYLLAGQQSSKAFIIDDAIHYYESALQLTEQHTQSSPLGETTHDRAVNKHKISAHTGLADNLIRRAQHELARRHYDLALSELAETDWLLSAQIHLKYGKSWETHHNHHYAMMAYEKAEQALSLHPVQSESWQQTQLNILSAKLYVCYWRNDIDLMATLLEKIEPMLEQTGDAYTQAKFYDNALHLRFRQTRFNLNHTDVMLAEKAYHASTQTDDADLQAYSLFVLGFTHYFSQSYDQAGPQLQQALKLAKQQNDRTLQTRCLTYLTILHRQLGDIDGTLSYSKQAMASAKLAAMDDYIAIAHANQAWVAYKQHKSRRALKLVALSHRTWQGLASQFPFPLQWLALLVELDLLTQQHQEAVDVTTWPRLMAVVESLIDSTQQRLPETITTPLKEVISLHNQRSANKSRSLMALASALYHSKRLGYL